MSAPKPLAQTTVLFVDDDADIRKMFRVVLEAAGATVLDAASSAGVTSVLRTTAVDAVVLDWHLAADSTGGLLTGLDAIRPGIGARVLVVSGDPRVVGPGASVLPAGTHALSKPFRPAELVVALRRLLDRS